MVLPVLDYCDAVWHECGQGNSAKIERLQRRAARIVYFKAASNLSTDQIMTKLGWKPLYSRRQENILRFVNECITNRVPRYLFNYFNVRNHDIPRYKTRSTTVLFFFSVIPSEGYDYENLNKIRRNMIPSTLRASKIIIALTRNNRCTNFNRRFKKVKFQGAGCLACYCQIFYGFCIPFLVFKDPLY